MLFPSTSWKAHLLGAAILLTSLATTANADCALNAKSKTSFVVLDSHTIILKGGFGKDILIKSFAFFHSSSDVTVLKDDFCDFESNVLYVDGETIDVQQVKNI
jgi:hypothetical protein